MRTIGKTRIDKIEALVIANIEHGNHGINLHEGVMLDIPKDWFDLWEGASAEIDRVVSDAIFRENRK